MELLHSVDERKLKLLEIIPNTKNGQILPDWWLDIKRDGKNSLKALPIPHSKTEGWRETNISPFFNPQRKWKISTKKNVDVNNVPENINKYFTPHIFWDNGAVKINSDTYSSLSNIKISDFKTILSSEYEEILKELLIQSKEAQHIFEAVAEMLLHNGIFIYLPKGLTTDTTLNIAVMSSAETCDTIDIPWIVIYLSDNSQAKLTLHFNAHNKQNNSLWVNTKTKIFLGKNAHLKILESIQGTPETLRFHSTSAILEQDSSMNYNSLHLSGNFIRSEIYVDIQGESSQCYINGLTLNEKKHFSETQQQIQHLRGNSISRIHWRGLGKEQSKTVYRGKIYIAPEAQKSDSIQQFKGLSVSDQAIIDAKPQLEIYADDVRCTHGATVGPPSPELIYYFQSRGIHPEKAKTMLIQGFANQVLGEFPFPEVRPFTFSLLKNTFSGF